MNEIHSFKSQPLLVQLLSEATRTITPLEMELSDLAAGTLAVDNHSGMDLIHLAKDLIHSEHPIVLLIWKEESASWGKTLPLLQELMQATERIRLVTNADDPMLAKLVPQLAGYLLTASETEALQQIREWLQSS